MAETRTALSTYIKNVDNIFKLVDNWLYDSIKFNPSTSWITFPEWPEWPGPGLDFSHPYDEKYYKTKWYYLHTTDARGNREYHVEETTNKRVFSFPLPGYDQNSIEVYIDNDRNTLEVSGKRGKDDPIWKNSFSYSIPLKRNENITSAYMKNGVLYIETEIVENKTRVEVKVVDNEVEKLEDNSDNTEE